MAKTKYTYFEQGNAQHSAGPKKNRTVEFSCLMEDSVISREVHVQPTELQYQAVVDLPEVHGTSGVSGSVHVYCTEFQFQAGAFTGRAFVLNK